MTINYFVGGYNLDDHLGRTIPSGRSMSSSMSLSVNTAGFKAEFPAAAADRSFA
ncbi:hypothetical protein [Bradyrhizobium sp. BTAi1]|uniref:hypothetical protein n=1 Tax=Bradyrhizobium sp. (strain BTAi1 / ATCC BAA-1182) TaxID=288000 RepID=UPI001438E880|nr:hypothetical protein [Bradyrhizobium sp. BTAi1]